MKNLWPESFKAMNIRAPNDILEEQAKFLLTITKGLVYAKVEKIDVREMVALTSNMTDFGYKLSIASKNLDKFKYRVLFVLYGIPVYPCDVHLDKDIGKELNLEGTIRVNDQEGLTGLLSEVFNSKKIDQVISSLLTLSK
jgi:hypothetical protein